MLDVFDDIFVGTCKCGSTLMQRSRLNLAASSSVGGNMYGRMLDCIDVPSTSEYLEKNWEQSLVARCHSLRPRLYLRPGTGPLEGWAGIQFKIDSKQI